MSEKLPVAITMGDPAGVGPELALRALVENSITDICTPVVFGDKSVLSACAEKLNLPFESQVVSLEKWLDNNYEKQGSLVVSLNSIGIKDFRPGELNAATGWASFQYIHAAIDNVISGRLKAVTTGPINKLALSRAGIHFPGHTEIFASRTNASRSCMMQYSDIITCTFVTVHVGYAEVPKILSPERILDVIELTVSAIRKIRGHEPRLLICGLNPHAGEEGLFGNREEELLIIPAVQAARNKGINIEGPLPPDTAFIPARLATTDAIVCMYHDQGHIPVKALAFDSAVNTTLGLPVIRTSVDHGTAYDIAWQGVASPSSLFAAIKLAVKLAE